MSDQHAHAETLAVLVADAVDVAVLDADDLLPAVQDPDVGVAGASERRNVQCVIRQVLHIRLGYVTRGPYAFTNFVRLCGSTFEALKI